MYSVFPLISHSWYPSNSRIEDLLTNLTYIQSSEIVLKDDDSSLN